MADSIEFYKADALHPFLTLQSSFQPTEGDLINIEKKTYEVVGRSFTIDHAATCLRSIRCNVILQESANA